MITYSGSFQKGEPWALYGTKDDVKPLVKPDGSGEPLPNGSTFWVMNPDEGDPILYMFDQEGGAWIPQA